MTTRAEHNLRIRALERKVVAAAAELVIENGAFAEHLLRRLYRDRDTDADTTALRAPIPASMFGVRTKEQRADASGSDSSDGEEAVEDFDDDVDMDADEEEDDADAAAAAGHLSKKPRLLMEAVGELADAQSEPLFTLNDTAFGLPEIFDEVVERLVAVAHKDWLALLALSVLARVSKMVSRRLDTKAHMHGVRSMMRRLSGDSLLEFASANPAQAHNDVLLQFLLALGGENNYREVLPTLPLPYRETLRRFEIAGRLGLSLPALKTTGYDMERENDLMVSYYIEGLVAGGHVRRREQLDAWFAGTGLEHARLILPGLRASIANPGIFEAVIRDDDDVPGMTFLLDAADREEEEGEARKICNVFMFAWAQSDAMFDLLMERKYGPRRATADGQRVWVLKEALKDDVIWKFSLHAHSPIRLVRAIAQWRRLHGAAAPPAGKRNIVRDVYQCTTPQDIADVQYVYGDDARPPAESMALRGVTPAAFDLVERAFPIQRWQGSRLPLDMIYSRFMEAAVEAENLVLLAHVLDKYQMHTRTSARYVSGLPLVVMHVSMYSIARRRKDGATDAVLAAIHAILVRDIAGGSEAAYLDRMLDWAQIHDLFEVERPSYLAGKLPILPTYFDTLWTYVAWLLAYTAMTKAITPTRYYIVVDQRGSDEERVRIQAGVEAFLQRNKDFLPLGTVKYIFDSLLQYANYGFLPFDISPLNAKIQAGLRANAAYAAAGFFEAPRRA